MKKLNYVSDVTNFVFIPSIFKHVQNVEICESIRSKRITTETNFNPNFITFLVEIEDIDKINEEIIYAYMLEEDPKTYEEAIKSIDSIFWKEAIDNELDSISNYTWELGDLPKGSKTIDSKWILKRKYSLDGSTEKFKGFTQKICIDHQKLLCVLIALATIHNLVIQLMDVKSTFINEDLKEEIYMKQVEGFITSRQEHKVCKLRKSLYGLK
ncbi:Copia protein, partial [Mucuna pruriens]